MTYEIANRPQSAWDVAPPVEQSDLLRGRTLKFNNGRYFADGVDLTGAHMIATDAAVLWVCWDGTTRGPAENRVTLPGDRHPSRGELDRFNESEWPVGLDGKPADPWRDTRHLFLTDTKTALPYTLILSSGGGRQAVADLMRQVGVLRRQRGPDALPIIELASGMMQTRYGLKPRPLFKIVGAVNTQNDEGFMLED